MIVSSEKIGSIASDAPQTDPANDAYGYAGFAARVAESLCTTPSPRGLVVAVHGPWGSGKTSLLNFVKHDIRARQESGLPILMDFNPWWFQGREDLTQQLLAQFRVKLLHESSILRKAGDALAEYSNAIGTTIATTYALPWLAKPIGWVLRLFKRKAKDVPALKEQIGKALLAAKQRFIFLVDDIDRLTPGEMGEVFKAIKALADFPNVIYLLAFDRSVVAHALHATLGVDGDAYLEKIVQAQFSLPVVDKQRLRRKLFAEMDKILESLPQRQFDQVYWGNVYFDGLDQFIESPRDIIRICNALSVTYPAVAGEVNPVDFIALEFLRLFLPRTYETVRDHSDMFAGTSRDNNQDMAPVRTFHENWLSTVPEKQRAATKDLLVRLFPKLGPVWGGALYGGDWAGGWRRKLRACSPEIFPVYFSFGVASDLLSRAELDRLVEAADDPDGAAALLTNATAIVRADGSSKARDYLERVKDLETELTPKVTSNLLLAIFKVGDHLLIPGDEQTGFAGVPNRWRLLWAVTFLLEKIPESDRASLLTNLAKKGEAICLITDVVDAIDEYRNKAEGHQSVLAHIDEKVAAELKGTVVARLTNMSPGELIEIPDLNFVIHRWARWAGPEVVRPRIAPLFSSDTWLPRTLEQYVQFSTTQGWEDRVAKRVPQLNPKTLEALTDIGVLEGNVNVMLKRTDLTPDQRSAGEEFLKGVEYLRQGKNPDRFFEPE